MDKIYVNDMAFYGYHGVLPEETKLGQRFTVSVVLELHLKEAGEADMIDKSIDYGLVYQLTRDVVEGQAKKLIEAVAEEIANSLLTRLDLLQRCTIKVEKPDPPIPGHYQSVAVEIQREKNQ